MVKKRVKRDFLESSSRQERSRSDRRPSRRAGTIRSVNYNLNDPRWTQMWYLVRLPIPLVYISCTGAQYWRLDQDGRVKSHGELLIVDSLLAAAHHHSCPHFFDCSFSGESGEWKEQGPRAYLHNKKWHTTIDRVDGVQMVWEFCWCVYTEKFWGGRIELQGDANNINKGLSSLLLFFFVVRWGGIDPSARVTRALVIIVNVYRSHGRPLIDPWCLFFLMKPMRRAPFRDRMGW